MLEYKTEEKEKYLGEGKKLQNKFDSDWGIFKNTNSFVNGYSKKQLDELISENSWNFFKDYLPKLGYESREGQEDMCFDIAEAIRDNQHIMVEAEVGIGKTFAYLIPLFFYNKYLQSPIVISTSTITLQEQLKNDINTISSNFTDVPEIVLAKGRTHFICKERALNLFNSRNSKLTEKYIWLKDWIEEGNGDRADLIEFIDDSLWNKLNVCDCKYKNCKYYSECYFIKKRDRMLKTRGIILCNHDLLIVDLQKKIKREYPLLSKDIKFIAIDEAHNLEEKVRNALKETWSFRDFAKIINEALWILNKSDNYDEELKQGEEATRVAEKFFKNLTHEIKEQVFEQNAEVCDIERFYIKNSYNEQLSLILNYIENLNISVQLVDFKDEYVQKEVIEKLSRAEDFFSNLCNKDSNTLYWLELIKGIAHFKNVLIMGCPKNLDEEINNILFSNRDFRTILTSATLTNKANGDNDERYAYITKTIGFPPSREIAFLADPKNSPYPYDENAMIYYREDMPHPTKEHDLFIKKSVEVIKEVISLTKGKSLILFTAKKDLEEVYSKLSEANLPWNILCQQEGSSQDNLVSMFKEDINSVLLGTGVFWEGVSVEGESLSNLIIIRLPFSVPDPITEYKSSCCKNPTMEVAVPEMLIKLRQGVGRLIRNCSDNGIVAILDSRVSDKSNVQYKELIWESLPMKNKTNDIEILKEFIKRKRI